MLHRIAIHHYLRHCVSHTDSLRCCALVSSVAVGLFSYCGMLPRSGSFPTSTALLLPCWAESLLSRWNLGQNLHLIFGGSLVCTGHSFGGFPVLMALTSSVWVISLSCLAVFSFARQISVHLLRWPNTVFKSLCVLLRLQWG